MTFSSAFYANHQPSADAILPRNTKDWRQVVSAGDRFFNMDTWRMPSLQHAMLQWAATHKGQHPSQRDVENWVREANNASLGQAHAEQDGQDGDPNQQRYSPFIQVAGTPSDLSRQTFLAIVGGVYHECWHTKYSRRAKLTVGPTAKQILSRWKKVPDWSRYAGFIMGMSNIVEDIRIERIGTQDYPGTYAKMEHLQDFILTQEAESDVHVQTKMGKKPELVGVISRVFRDIGLGYDTELQRDALVNYRKWHPKAVAMVVTKDGPLRKLLDKAITLGKKDDQDCLWLAMDIVIELHKAAIAPPKPPKPPKNGQQGQKGQKGQGQPQQGQSGGGQSQPQDGKDSDKSDGAEGNGKGKDGSEGKGSGSDGKDGDDKDADGSGNGAKEGKDGKDGNGSEGSHPGEAAGDADGQGSSGNADGAEGKDGDGPQANGKGKPQGGKVGEGKPQDGQPTEGTDDRRADPMGDGHVGLTGAGGFYNDMSDHDGNYNDIAAQSLRDAIKGQKTAGGWADAVEKAIGDAQKQEDAMCARGERPWRPYSTDGDKEQVVKSSSRGKQSDTDAANKLLASVKTQCTYLRTKLRQLVREAEMVGIEHGTRRGRRLSPRTMTNTYISIRNGRKPTRAYMQRDEDIDTSMAAAIVVDESGSMASRLRLTSQGLVALVEPLDKLGVATQVVGFRDGSWGGGTEDNHRSGSIKYDVFKRFEERFNNVKHRFNNLRAAGGTPMADGIAHGMAALNTRIEGHRVLFVFTDGQPNNEHRPVVRWQIRKCREAGIHIVGVGLGPGASYVSNLFDDSVFVRDLNELPRALSKKLTELLNFRHRREGRGKRGRKVQVRGRA